GPPGGRTNHGRVPVRRRTHTGSLWWAWVFLSSEQGGLVHPGRELFGERRHRQTRPVGQPVVSVVGVQVAQVIGVLAIRGLVPQPVGRFLVAVEVGARSTHGALLSGRGPTRPGRSPTPR